MARKPRVEFPGALYHVIVRGNNRERIFFLEKEKEKYLAIVRHYKEKYGFKLFAFVILDNHAHMLIEGSTIPLSKIMQGIQQVFTMYYNEKYDRVGHVFQQRYKANICDKENYLLALVRYIHQNPLRAGITEGLDYEWSSHRIYLNPDKQPLVNVNFVLQMFHDQPSEAILSYMRFMGEESEQKIGEVDPDHFYANTSTGPEEEIRVKYNQAVDLYKILELVNEATGLSEEVIRSGGRSREIVNARKLFIWLAYRYCIQKQSEIACYLGVSEPAVTKLLDCGREEGSLQKKLFALEKIMAEQL